MNRGGDIDHLSLPKTAALLKEWDRHASSLIEEVGSPTRIGLREIKLGDESLLTSREAAAMKNATVSVRRASGAVCHLARGLCSEMGIDICDILCSITFAHSCRPILHKTPHEYGV